MENQDGLNSEKPPPYEEVQFQPQFQNQPVVQNAMHQPNAWPAQGGIINQPPTFPHVQQGYHGGFYVPGTTNQQPPNGNFAGAPAPAGYPNRPFVTNANLGEEGNRRRQENAIRDGIMTAMTRQPYSTNPYSRRTCTYKCTRTLIGFFISGLILLIILGVLVVGPAMKDTHLKSTWCRVISSEETSDDESCKCGRYCYSSYPCLEIRVSFHPAGRGNTTSYLYQNVYDDKNQCSTQPCDSSSWLNSDSVEDFKDSFGRVGQEYSCYYDPSSMDAVYKNKSDNKSDQMTIMHCILWPLVLMAACAGGMLLLYCRAKGRCCFPSRESPNVPYESLQPPRA